MHKIKSFIDKHIDKRIGPEEPIQRPPPPLVAPPQFSDGTPNERDLYLYRRQQGVNLGITNVSSKWNSY